MSKVKELVPIFMCVNAAEHTIFHSVSTSQIQLHACLTSAELCYFIMILLASPYTENWTDLQKCITQSVLGNTEKHKEEIKKATNREGKSTEAADSSNQPFVSVQACI